jgi:tetraacyldisaccharide 4'-kinase
VIVVGNINVGGTGKTPLVIWLASHLARHGYRPGIVSRGYGGSAEAPVAVATDSVAAVVGDEPLLLARRTACPVWIGRDRPLAAQALLAAHSECDVLICDDGLQHYALARDVEIAVVDGRRRFGNGRLLPAGPLRELPLRLNKVDAIVIHGGDAQPGEYALELVGTTFRNLRNGAMTASNTDLAGLKLHAVAGIGDPQRFFEALRRQGLQVVEHPFPDHHLYQPADLQFEGAQAVLMTEKDAVKCIAFSQPHWWYLEVEARVNAKLGSLIMRKLEDKHGR